ncbi:uncharacterized membrane protein [Streptomyces sp. TLI_55]|uniref:DUF1269 domain-containing protein n=1 Tax=Streptomyces sp. TLI_55 TaxID=1938861 RepID=UPI000BC6EF66|nr:DUF1269 domain-containing protein [Streptomyces sp. TLI_55]SNX66231.1 uncharacterized membrane protein [Streptomyces sp. TLI_55]
MKDTRSRNVIAIRFAEDDKTYRALARLKKADAEGLVDVHAAVVAERTADGALEVMDGTDNVTAAAATSGSLIGALVGLLGGPFTVLLGWGAGALVGGAIDMHRASGTDAALSELARTVSPGRTALIAEVTETRESVIDADVAAGGGTVVRRPAHEVLDEFEATADAAREAQAAAAATLRTQKRTEPHEEFHERWETISNKMRL